MNHRSRNSQSIVSRVIGIRLFHSRKIEFIELLGNAMRFFYLTIVWPSRYQVVSTVAMVLFSLAGNLTSTFAMPPAFLDDKDGESQTVSVNDVGSSGVAGDSVNDATKKLDLPKEVSFNRHIQPILSEYCYHCHGPDSSTRQPDDEPLRLDIAEQATAIRESGDRVIVKGNAAESELIRQIKSEMMPPPESHKSLGAKEIALLEKWIEQGAIYEGHWSYEPVVRVEPPKNEWSDKPIDGFIFEKLRESGLQPNPDESPRRFHRRLSLDLTGLPPEPDQTDAFVAAYEKNAEVAIAAEADRMLATIQSAEHFARHWLDAVRYGDTHGIHNDNYRSIWPYRDWVIRAFHENKKWDQFTTEQIAGDLLPEPTLDQKVATGFLRALVTTGEGGAIAEEYEAIYANDRVDTVGAVWLGMSASCASCHDHKFDPLSTKEFYQLTAFFRNNTIKTLDGNNANHPPTIVVPMMEDREKLAQNRASLQDVANRKTARRQAADGDFKQWLATAQQAKSNENMTALAIHLPLNEANGPLHGTVDDQAREWPADAARVDGPHGKALVVSGGNIELGDVGNFSRGDQVSYGGFIWIEGKPNGAVIAKMDPANGYRGWDIWLQNGQVGSHVIDSWPTTADKLIASPALTEKTWHHVMIIFDGTRSGDQAMSIFIDGKRAEASFDPNSLKTHNDGTAIETKVPLRIGARHDGSGKVSGKVALQDFRFYRRLLTEAEITELASPKLIDNLVAIPANERTADQNAALFGHYIAHVDPASLAIAEEEKLLKEAEGKIRSAPSLIYEEKKNQEPYAHVLNRGSYSDKGDKVLPNTPAALPPMPEGAPKNRLGLAMWLNDPQNPLPSRVTMNRLWYYFFGTGFVESNGDFGVMGARPTHPQLLDWLAAEFVASEWNHRHMVKTIVTSRAYRQSGSVSPEKYEIDPANVLVSRGPRTRLEAEQLRDLALATSGLLSKTVGGASVKPYQPEFVWEAVAMHGSNTRHYKQDSGEALYRRSLYTFWKRTAAPPTMEILDAPNREAFCVRRDRTNTPLQALVLMNDPQFVEAGRVLAAKAIAAHDSFDERLDMLTLRLIARKMDAAERAVVKATLTAATEHYTDNPEDARLALSVGETKVSESIAAVELAAWSLVASQLMNLDETVTR